jgi:hypothetical protein
VIAYQEILGTEKAANFVESMQTLMEHLEVRQRQLATELHEITETIEVFKRFGTSDNGRIPEALQVAAIAHLEQADVPQLQAVTETVAPEDTDEGFEPPRKRRGRKAKEVSESAVEEPEIAFHPRRSTLREFQGKTLRDAITMILQRRAGEALSVDDIMYALYGKNVSKAGFKAAKPVVISELSKGKLSNYWSSVAGRRGYYTIEPGASEAEAE